MAWPEGSLAWRMGGWFIAALALGYLNHRLLKKAFARAMADVKKGAAKLMPWYLVRMFLNFSMMLLVFFIDGHMYSLMAVVLGLLIPIIAEAISGLLKTT